MKKHRRLAFVCLAGSLCASSYADLNMNGFATMAGGMTFSDEESLDGYDNYLSFTENSLLGIQIKADLGDKLTATAQIISKGSENWNAKFEWAYIGYEASDNIKILLGRQRAPYYNYSDYLDVSYAYHWITPPESVYNLPFDTTNGVGAVITNELGPFESTLHFVYGAHENTINVQGEEALTEVGAQISAAWNLNWEWLSLRFGYSEADRLKLHIQQMEALAAGWAEAGFDQFVPIISTSDDDNSGSFLDLGFTVDYENWLINAEYTELSLTGVPLSDTRSAWYTSVGYRFGNVMPHFTFGKDDETPIDDSFLDDVPLGIDPGLDGLVAVTSELINSATNEAEYYILGVRWDFHGSAAFKLDYKYQTNKLTDDTDNLLRFAVVTVF
ncbi:porin [Teredinibacter franksiae]|uniref:porin n=1 Tax=Teredinibacter franksiae TaxID=2761453 RepID=UPI00162635DD|nr:porin [Teredinibacter franksiae]